MARSKTSVSARLKKLRAAKARIMAMPRGEVLNARPMAKALGVTWPTLRDWCNEIDGFDESGAYEQGAQGMDYEFCPVRTVWFLIDHFETLVEEAAGKTRELREAAGVDMPDDEEVSIEDTRGLVDLTMKVVASKRESGAYIPAIEMTTFIDGYNQVVVDGIMGVGTKLDPNGLLDPKVRSKVDTYLRELATSVHASATKFIGRFREGLQQEGTRSSG